MTYLQTRLDQLGVKDYTIQVQRIEGETEIVEKPYFESDNQDNIRILYPNLDGAVYTYKSNTKDNPEKWFYRTRLKNPTDPKNKYTQPAGSGLRPFFPKEIITKYQAKTAIDTLIITEGEFKAVKGCIDGLKVIGAPSIHGFYDDQKGLHYDIVRVIETCQVKNIVFLTDADTLTVNWEPKKDLAKRPTSFYTAVRNFADAVSKLNIQHLKCYFAHISTKFADNAKGLDDLLCSLDDPAKQDALFELNFLSGKKKYFNIIDVTRFQKSQLIGYFGLKSLESFYKMYKQYINEEPFVFREVEYQLKNKQLEVVQQEDEFEQSVQNTQIFTAKRLEEIKRIAESNNRKGTPINKTISDCLYQFQVDDQPVNQIKLRSIIEKIYLEQQKLHNIDNKHYILKLRTIFENNYPNFRRNELSGACEMDGKVLTDSDMNTMILDIEVSELLGYNRDGKPVAVPQDKFYQFINSNYTKSYHPIKEFFEKTQAKPDGSNIAKLAKCIIGDTANVINKDGISFNELFVRKWLVSAIASVYGTPNPLLLILCGTTQRTGKTEFFRRLLPKEIMPFMSENKITEEKDQVLAMIMSEKFLVLDDEMTGLSKADAKKVKYLCSVQSFTYRRPYAKGTSTVMRLANLAATTNDPSILSDPTGNRRLIPIDVQRIDHALYNTIDKNELWIEAYNLYQSGYEFELNSYDVKFLNDNTQDFQSVDRDMELIVKFFEPPVESEGLQKYLRIEDLTASDICLYIADKTKERLNPNSIGLKLKKLGFIQKRTMTSRTYKVGVLE